MSQTLADRQHAWVKEISGGAFDPAVYPVQTAQPAGGASGGGAAEEGKSGGRAPSSNFPQLTTLFGNRGQARAQMALFDKVIKVNDQMCLVDGRPTKVRDVVGPVYHQMERAIHAMEGVITAGHQEAEGLVKTRQGSFFVWLSDHLHSGPDAVAAAQRANDLLNHATSGLQNATSSLGKWNFFNAYMELCGAVDLMQGAAEACLKWSGSVSSAAGNAATALEATRDLCITALVTLTPMAAGAEYAMTAVAVGATTKGAFKASDHYFAGKPVPWAEISIDLFLDIVCKGCESTVKAKMTGYAKPLEGKCLAKLAQYGVTGEKAKEVFKKTVEYCTLGGMAFLKEVAHKIYHAKPTQGETDKESMPAFVGKSFSQGIAEEVIDDLLKQAVKGLPVS